MTFPATLAGHAHRYLNERALGRAGRHALADIEHVGRRTGQLRHTPVRAFRHGETVVIGLNFGNESDWVRNIVAAGGCRMRLADQHLTLTDPRVVPLAEGARGMPWWFGAGLRHLVRTRDCLELTVAASAPFPG